MKKVKKHKIGIKIKLASMVIIPIIVLGTTLSVMAQETMKKVVANEIFRNLNTAAVNCYAHASEYDTFLFLDLARAFGSSS